MAKALLPPSSKIQVVHLGNALDETLAEEARKEMAVNPRYRWLGERPQAEALRMLASSRLMVLTSRLEGGANVVSEEIACSVPVISSRIPGSIGLLGELLAAKTRSGPYGGSLENRTRLARDIITAICAEVPGLMIATRMNVFDCIPYQKEAGGNLRIAIGSLAERARPGAS